MTRLFSFLLAVTIAGATWAAEAPPDILKTDLMVVVAHPDDEGMVATAMAKYALGQGKVVTVVYATRGEGGGNAVGTQRGEALGELREAELREAMDRVGVRHVYFLDKTDWAYTESAAATLEKWGHDDSLSRLVRLVRNLRPETLVTFLPAPTGGQHGHHQTAGILATEAFDAAADPAMFPDQIKVEGLRPWQVKRLYYPYKGPDSVEVPLDGKTPDGRTFAEIAGEAESHHRSQGFGGFRGQNGPVQPQSFSLVKSAVPDASAQNDLLDGTGENRLMATVEPETYQIGPKQIGKLRLVMENNSDEPITNFSLSLKSPEGWKFLGEEALLLERLEPGQRVELPLTVQAPSDVAVGHEASLRFSLNGKYGNQAIIEAISTTVMSAPSIEAEVVPLPGIQRYRDWTRTNRIERFAGVLPSWVPLAAGQAGTVRARITNRGPQPAKGQASLAVPGGWKVEPASQPVTVGSNSETEAVFQVTPPADALVADVPLKVNVNVDSPPQSGAVTGEGVAQVTPFLSAPRLSHAPAIDGKLDDWAGSSEISIPHTNLVQGQFKDDADGSAIAHVGYDDHFLYVGIQVRDDVISTNIAPDDIKAHWRSDSVEIDVDPKPRAESTLTTFKLGIFPWDTAGHVRAGRDADADQGPVEETAPGTKLASVHTSDGYIIEAALPWESIGVKPKSGMNLGFNIILFDADQKDARIGDDINKGRLAWSFRPGIWGRPEQWGAMRLQ